MDFDIIAEQLIKRGFLKGDYGALEKRIGAFDIAFVDDPFFHYIMYSRKSEDGRTLYVPSEIKLPQICDSDDILFVIDNLVKGVDEYDIVMSIFKKLNPQKPTYKKEYIVNLENDKGINKINFEIKETVGTLSGSSKGWNKELNIVSWNYKEAKYDIRDWDSEHKKMGKGINFRDFQRLLFCKG